MKKNQKTFAPQGGAWAWRAALRSKGFCGF
jgi:hypothetical protein